MNAHYCATFLPSLPLSFIHNKLHKRIKNIKHRHNCHHAICYIIREESSSIFQQKHVQWKLLYTVTITRQASMC